MKADNLVHYQIYKYIFLEKNQAIVSIINFFLPEETVQTS